MEEDRAMEFLRTHKISKAKRKEFKDDDIPIQYYLSTWEISKIMVEYAKQRLEKGQVDTIVMPTLTPIRDSQLQRERDVMSYIAETIELMGGDGGPGLDTLENWLYRMRKKALA